MSLFDGSASSYQSLLQGPSPSPQDLALREGQLTWLVYLIGSVIGGRISHTNADHYDAMDGQLVCRYKPPTSLFSPISCPSLSPCRVLQLMNMTDLHLPQHGCEHLDKAFLHFFEKFRMVYVGEVVVQKASKVLTYTLY